MYTAKGKLVEPNHTQTIKHCEILTAKCTLSSNNTIFFKIYSRIQTKLYIQVFIAELECAINSNKPQTLAMQNFGACKFRARD